MAPLSPLCTDSIATSSPWAALKTIMPPTSLPTVARVHPPSLQTAVLPSSLTRCPQHSILCPGLGAAYRSPLDAANRPWSSTLESSGLAAGTGCAESCSPPRAAGGGRAPGQPAHPAVSQPLPPRGSSNPGGCAPRAATSLAQSRASEVSWSGPFLPGRVGWGGRDDDGNPTQPWVSVVPGMAKPLRPAARCYANLSRSGAVSTFAIILTNCTIMFLRPFFKLIHFFKVSALVCTAKQYR